MRATSVVIPFITAAFILGCNQKETAPGGTQVGKTPASPSAIRLNQVPDAFKVGISKVLDGYFPVQKALAVDDFTKAKDAFMFMHGLLHTIPIDGLDSVALKSWNDSNEAMMEILHPMASSEDITEFRQGFAQFSDHLAGLVDAFGEKGIDSVFHIHCPMAFDNKGADWLQLGKTIANPYLGMTMPTCGKIKRKINPS